MRTFGCLVLAMALAISACGGQDRGGGRPEGRGRTNAGAQIEPKLGIAGVRLGASAAQVRTALAEPDRTAPSELHGGWTKWTYGRLSLRVTFDEKGRVWDVRTYSPTPRTARGVGVGSTRGELRAAMPSLICRPHGGPARYRDWVQCVDTRDYSGAFTEFTLVDRRVERVTVARGLAR